MAVSLYPVIMELELIQQDSLNIQLDLKELMKFYCKISKYLENWMFMSKNNGNRKKQTECIVPVS